jgi:hypothetical protein
MSLLGLFQNNPSLFLELELPDGVSKDAVIDNLLMETAELEVLYPNPYFMQAAIGTWSIKELPVWQKLYETTVLKYDPIHNYDRNESWTENENTDKEGSSENRGSVSTETEGKRTQNRNGSGTVDTSHYVSAYNETDFTPTAKDTENQNASSSTNQQDSSSVDSSESSSGNTSESEKRSVKRKGEVSGNTGFYTKQKMIEQEREIAMFNIIDHIISSFKNRFCLLIY